ncbi:gas vesicle protein [Roseomonas sp. GC11]|uniref:gas vesicle protein GvpO n=1 Tax=Roseomonas sp. GC11 TaxID=2950546 RepID=UPI00210C0FE1|nr:gas vesicle protein GvpO [Roseomonas sp. GC11]MCQ4161672.1 gas vesicle protein [Roseomonas sp. GC11]
MDTAALVARAKQQLEALLGLPTDTVSRFDRAPEGGWALGLDMLEHSAIPRTHDLIARYEIELDEEGTLRRWKRTARTQRGQLLEES